MDFEQAITEGIVKQFFAPQPYSYQDSTGQYVYGMTVPPSGAIVTQLFQANQAKILQAVIDSMDIDALGTAVADKVVTALGTEPKKNSWNRTEADKLGEQMRKEIHERVVSIVAQRQADRIMADCGETQPKPDILGG